MAAKKKHEYSPDAPRPVTTKSAIEDMEIMRDLPRPPRVVPTDPFKTVPQVQTPEPNSVDFRVFATACGIKLDQLAGFAHHVKSQGLTARPMQAWREELDKFNRKPTR